MPPGIEGTMKEFKAGDLKSGSGQKVVNRRQALAIGLSSERKARSSMGKRAAGMVKGR